MKIISIFRTLHFAQPGNPLPGEFTVGESPVPDSPVVEKIVPMRDGKLDFYPNACYVIHFTDSKVRRIIPAGEVVDIAYDTSKEETKDAEKVPDLPEV